MKKTATLGLGALYVIGSGIAAAPIDVPNDLNVFFLPSAAIALAGHPFSVYAVRSVTTLATYANANGPLSLVPLTAVAWLAERFGWLGHLRPENVIVTAAFSVFTFWMAIEAIRAIDRCRAVPLSRLARLVAFAVVAASPVLWISEIGYGHVEQPIAIGLILLSVRALAADRPALAGLVLGLTGLTRTLSLIFAVPLALILWKRRGPAMTLQMIATAVVTVAIGLLPFVLADPGNVIFSMVRQHADLPVGTGSLWYLVLGAPIASFGRNADTLIGLLAVVVSTLILLRLRPDIGFDDADLYGLLAVIGIWSIVLIKVVWPYYLVEPFIFASIWVLARARPALAWGVPAFLTVMTLIAEVATRREETLLGTLATTALVFPLLAFIVVVAVAIARRSTLPASGELETQYLVPVSGLPH
jgi:hypothetical protein